MVSASHLKGAVVVNVTGQEILHELIDQNHVGSHIRMTVVLQNKLLYAKDLPTQ